MFVTKMSVRVTNTKCRRPKNRASAALSLLALFHWLVKKHENQWVCDSFSAVWWATTQQDAFACGRIAPHRVSLSLSLSCFVSLLIIILEIKN